VHRPAVRFELSCRFSCPLLCESCASRAALLVCCDLGFCELGQRGLWLPLCPETTLLSFVPLQVIADPGSDVVIVVLTSALTPMVVRRALS
jgi:hypothetical protein